MAIPVKVGLSAADSHRKASGEGSTDGAEVIIRAEQHQPADMSDQKSQPVITLKQITKTYGKGDAAFEALRGVDLIIHKGEFVADGAERIRKSTLMNLLGCLDTPTSGHYDYQGVSVPTLNSDQRSLLRRHALGFVFQGLESAGPHQRFGECRASSVVSWTHQARSVGNVPAKRRIGRASHKDAQYASRALGWTAATCRDRPGSGYTAKHLVCGRATGNLDTTTTDEIMELLTSLNSKYGYHGRDGYP